MRGLLQRIYCSERRSRYRSVNEEEVCAFMRDASSCCPLRVRQL
ncbi:hypothetical protein C7S13_4261 [Burkholderia cepacia]|nr:hypothetical protein [Burkholderia cepacia]